MKRKQEPFWKRLKEFEFKTWYIAVIVIIAVLIRFWGENTITLLQKDVPIVTNTEISLDEITRFITTKQQYIADNINIDPMLSESYYLEDKLDKKLHEWFLVRKWRPKRYFYVEKRINLILAHIRNQEHMLNEADRLEREAANLLKKSNHPENAKFSDQAAALDKKAYDIRYYIDRDIRQAGISTREEEAVRDYRSILEPLIER